MLSRSQTFVLIAALSAAFAGACHKRQPALQVAAEGARACDVLMDVGSAPDPEVDFGANVRGQISHRGARLGVSWIASNDHAFDPVAVTLRGAAGAKILTSTCYDGDGRPIANPDVTLR